MVSRELKLCHRYWLIRSHCLYSKTAYVILSQLPPLCISSIVRTSSTKSQILKYPRDRNSCHTMFRRCLRVFRSTKLCQLLDQNWKVTQLYQRDVFWMYHNYSPYLKCAFQVLTSHSRMNSISKNKGPHGFPNFTHSRKPLYGTL